MSTDPNATVDPLVTLAGFVIAVTLARVLARLVFRRWRLPHWTSVAPGMGGDGSPVTPAKARTRHRLTRVGRFLTARVASSHFQGLPLTLIVLAAVCLAFTFAGLTEAVFESEELAVVDHRIVQMIAPLRDPMLVTVLDWITEFGSTATLTAVAITASGFLWAYGPANMVGPVWLTVAGSQLTTWAGKFLVDRPRPDFILDITAVSPSFPSAHAAGAVAVYGITAYALVRNRKSASIRFEIVFWTAILIALVAVSRVFLSVHHPSDVLGGMIVGAFWLLAGIAFAEAMRRKPST